MAYIYIQSSAFPQFTHCTERLTDWNWDGWQASTNIRLCSIDCIVTRLLLHYNHFTALCILSGTTRMSWYQKKHSPTHTYHGHQSSLVCFLHPLWSMASSLFNLRTWQSFCTISLQVFFGLPLGLSPLHTPYISSPNHCLLFAAHAHTIATCFAVVPRLCHLILVSLSTLYLKLYLVA